LAAAARVDSAQGDYPFGFMAVITGAPRANNARAREACCLLEFPRAAFLEIYNGNSGATVYLKTFTTN
jgi:CRP-like cAMP-binding protein